jgi:fimbrial isopeptide formation D2 family protein/LPXTG-motif cell wall-anchored protein
MKLFKKLAAALVATMLVMAMVGTSAFAATVKNSGTTPVDITSHTFKAYPVFTGTQGSGSTLSDIEWANGFDKDGFVTDLAEAFPQKGFATTKSPSEIADIIGTFASFSEDAEKVAQIAYKHKGATGVTLTIPTTQMDAGYYLVVDETVVDGKDDVANAALLQVTDTITITVKTDKPSVEKKVIENVKYATSGTGALNYNSGSYLVKHENDTADYNIGDDVPFRLHSVAPDMSDYVGPYVYIFHDTMAASLTYNDDAKLYVNGAEVPSGKYEVTASGQELTVKIPKLQDIAEKGDLVTVEFTAELNKNAYIGREADGSGTGNVNKVYLEYSNQPNYEGSGTKTGKTPEDKVIVFTYKLDVNKVDPSGTLLDGAKFKFYKLSGSTPVYVTVDGENKVDTWTPNSGTATEFVSASGTFGIVGLDDGIYYLVETEAPANYNKLPAPIEVVITADTTNGQEGNAAVNELTELFVTADGESGTTSSGTDMALSFDVENKAGTILPSTGGIGTTIFYVLGAILVLGGGVLLVTRRRMAA